MCQAAGEYKSPSLAYSRWRIARLHTAPRPVKDGWLGRMCLNVYIIVCLMAIPSKNVRVKLEVRVHSQAMVISNHAFLETLTNAYVVKLQLSLVPEGQYAYGSLAHRGLRIKQPASKSSSRRLFIEIAKRTSCRLSLIRLWLVEGSTRFSWTSSGDCNEKKSPR